MPSNDERLATLEQKVSGLENTVKEMSIDIKEIKDKLLLRPSWSVLTIITLLSTLCSGLIVFTLTKI